jgi:two-component system cell cycle sensor histidine kinase/response regulator CckA
MKKFTLFFTPTFEDAETERDSRLLYNVSGITMFAFLFLGIITAIFVPANFWRTLTTILVISFNCSIVILLARTGKTYFAGIFYVFQLWLIFTILAATGGGIFSVAVPAYLVVIIAAGLLLGWRPGLFTAVICIVTEIGLSVAGKNNFLRSRVHISDIQYLIINTLLAFLVIVLVYYFTKSIKELLNNYENELAERKRVEQLNKETLYNLGQRIKELTAIHKTSLILKEETNNHEIMEKIVRLIQPAFQFPEYTHARICLGNDEVKTPDFKESTRILRTDFEAADGKAGIIEVFYVDESLTFLPEELDLLKTLAVMLKAEYDHLHAVSALVESEHELRTLFAAMSDGVLVFDRNVRYVKIAPTNYQFAFGGEGPEFLIGKSIHELTPPAVASFMAEKIKQVLDTKQPHNFEYLVEGTKKPYWIYVTASPFSEDSVLWMVRDITEKKLAEKLSREREVQYKELVDSARDIIFTVSVDGTFLTINQAFETIQGWQTEEWLGKNFSELINPSDLSLANEIYEKVISGLTILPTELRVLTKSGNYITVELTAVPQTREGKVIGVLCISRDVTGRKELEEQLRRTQRLESLGALAGGIAHDLNNVLSPIMISLEIFRMKLTEPRMLSVVDSLYKSANRGKELVKRVLTFARGSGEEFVPQQLRLHLEEMRGLINDSFPKNINFRLNISNDLPAVLGESTQLHQVLLNLCVNARDAMPDGGNLQINASSVYLDEEAAKLIPLEKAGEYVVISVADNGDGIPAEIQEKLFEPFFTTKEVGKGTGLGLSTVHTIIKEHRGIIKLFSKVGEGTEFKIYLPALAEQDAKIEKVEEKLPSGNGELILVVDDEKSVLNIACEVLETYGYRVKTATNGVDALLFMSETPPGQVKIVLTDINMPRLDGFETIKLLRQTDSEVKVIIASGSIDNFDKMDSSQLNIQGILEKPYTSSQLLNSLHLVLKS